MAFLQGGNKMKRLSYFLALFLVVLLTACSTGGYKNVSSEEAKQLIDSNEVVVLDVRTPEEYEEGHIPNSILVPVQELEFRLNELGKEENYLVVCRSGNRSTQASEILINNKFTNIYNMTGGMNNWTYEIDN
jgi:rhodanese-related sulfurtransferase